MKIHNLEIINDDCMDVMKTYKDNEFDLAVVDPPYGIDINNQSQGKGGGVARKIDYAVKDWDKCAPDKEYFFELWRVSKNQIIWGANHFIESVYFANSPCWIVWDKINGKNDFADCELACTSFKTAVRIFRFMWNGMLQGEMHNKEHRIHPTQKPVKLYEWIYMNYAEEGQSILDTHLGSGSNAIAAHYEKMGRFVGIELDEDYYKAACKRIKTVTKQTTLF